MKILKVILCALIMVCTLSLLGCAVNDSKTVVTNLKTADSKFISNDNVLTSVSGNMTFISKGVAKDLNIKSNWLDSITEKNKTIIVYSNFGMQTGICILDDKGEVVENRAIRINKLLCIDPSILKIKDTYYITSTQIEGNVNNVDANLSNGEYTVQLFKSKDLVLWEPVADIVKYKNNIEDVELSFDDGIMYFVYEKEVKDKGLSSVCIRTSIDFGKNWSEEKKLLKETADQEPARFIKIGDYNMLFYSSDKDNLGKSYTKSKVYYAVFDENFECTSKDNLINVYNSKGSLLYDVNFNGKQLKLLYSNDYLNRNILTCYSLNINKN